MLDKGGCPYLRGCQLCPIFVIGLPYSVLGCPGLGLGLGFGVGLWLGVGVWDIPGHLLAANPGRRYLVILCIGN